MQLDVRIPTMDRVQQVINQEQKDDDGHFQLCRYEYLLMEGMDGRGWDGGRERAHMLLEQVLVDSSQ